MHRRPPLPFVGNKFRWHRILEPLIGALPRHAVVFDAFGGSMAMSRMIKDMRPDITCICNDAGMAFRRRLAAVHQTNLILARMRAVGAHGVSGVHLKYTDAELAQILDIALDAEDDITIATNIYTDSNSRCSIRKRCRADDYDERVCATWTQGIVVIDEMLDASAGKYYARSCDLVILDPPYARREKTGIYLDATVTAQAFCRAVMDAHPRLVWLFEEPASPLMRHASSLDYEIVRYDGKQNHKSSNMSVNEYLALSQPRRIERAPVQLDLFRKPSEF